MSKKHIPESDGHRETFASPHAAWVSTGSAPLVELAESQAAIERQLAALPESGPAPEGLKAIRDALQLGSRVLRSIAH